MDGVGLIPRLQGVKACSGDAPSEPVLWEYSGPGEMPPAGTPGQVLAKGVRPMHIIPDDSADREPRSVGRMSVGIRRPNRRPDVRRLIIVALLRFAARKASRERQGRWRPGAPARIDAIAGLVAP